MNRLAFTVHPLLLLPLTLFAINAAPTASSPPEEDFGIWKNPNGSVHIKIVSCGEARCGVAVWANEKAKADSRKGGTKELIGTMLLRDFRKQAAGKWKGKALIPDIGKEFSGMATVVDANTITVKGCLVWKVGCKSQTWTRVSP